MVLDPSPPPLLHIYKRRPTQKTHIHHNIHFVGLVLWICVFGVGLLSKESNVNEKRLISMKIDLHESVGLLS